MSPYLPLEQKARHLKEIPVLFYGDEHHQPCGDAAAQLRAWCDTSHTMDGDPALCDGWAALTPAEQAVLAADFADWLARKTSGLGILRGAA